MSNYVGDFTLGATVDMQFTTVGSDGSPQALTGGTVCLFADNSATSLTSGVTLTLNFGSINGLNHVRIAATTGNGFAAGSSYHAIVSGGSISAIDLKGYAIGHFSLQQRYTNVAAWAGQSVTASFLLPVTVRVWDQTSVSSSNVAVQDFSTRLNANVQQWVGVSVTSNNVAIWQSISTANVTAWNGKSTSTSDLAAFSVSQTVLTSATVAGAVNVDRIAGVTISASIITNLGATRVFKTDIVAKAGISVTASTLFPVVVRVWDTVSVSSSNVAVADFSTRLNANVQQWAGASVTTNNVAVWQSISTANVTAWNGKSTSTSDLAAFSVSQTVLTSATIAGSVDVGSWAGVSVSTNQIAVRTTLAKGAQITGFNDVSKQSISAIMFSTQMTEGYAITTSAMTLPQAVYSLWSFLTQFGISGTTYTSKKLDKTTAAMTFSLDSAVTPSAITRET